MQTNCSWQSASERLQVLCGPVSIQSLRVILLAESYGRTDLHEKFVSLHGCPTIHQWYMNESPVPRTFIYAAIKYLNIIRDNNRGLVARLCKVIFTAIRARTEAPLANNDKAKLPVAVAVADAAMPCRLGVNGNTKQLYVNSSRKYSYADTR